jgi:hypothetical protein
LKAVRAAVSKLRFDPTIAVFSAPMNREQIIVQIKRTAEANGNVPLGEPLFFSETRLTRNALRRNGFANYGSAVRAAGCKPNQSELVL